MKIAEFLALSISVSLAALFVLKSWQDNPRWLLAAWLLGPVAGYLTYMTGIEWLAPIMASIAAITAPATLMRLEGKTMTEVLDEARRTLDKVKGKGKGGGEGEG